MPVFWFRENEVHDLSEMRNTDLIRCPRTSDARDRIGARPKTPEITKRELGRLAHWSRMRFKRSKESRYACEAKGISWPSAARAAIGGHSLARPRRPGRGTPAFVRSKGVLATARASVARARFARQAIAMHRAVGGNRNAFHWWRAAPAGRFTAQQGRDGGVAGPIEPSNHSSLRCCAGTPSPRIAPTFQHHRLVADQRDEGQARKAAGGRRQAPAIVPGTSGDAEPPSSKRGDIQNARGATCQP